MRNEYYRREARGSMARVWKLFHTNYLQLQHKWKKSEEMIRKTRIPKSVGGIKVENAEPEIRYLKGEQYVWLKQQR